MTSYQSFVAVVSALLLVPSLGMAQTELSEVQVGLSESGASSLQEVVLLRHAEPDLATEGWFKRSQARAFLQDYDRATVKAPTFNPVVGSRHLDTLVVSSLPRAQATAEALFPGHEYYADSLFRPMDVQIVKFPLPPMPLKAWLFISRASWHLGLNDRQVENFKEARRRAHNAAVWLDLHADQAPRTVVVGHASFNRYVAKYLEQMGWRLERYTGKHYLGAYKLVKIR